MSVVRLRQQFQRAWSSLCRSLVSVSAMSSSTSDYRNDHLRMLLMSTPGASYQIVHQPAVPAFEPARRISLWLRVNICIAGRVWETYHVHFLLHVRLSCRMARHFDWL
jgi:hypothetical protein